mmetsp:Transcript_26662/g.87416  ORF Transcript_26662/g.87416 Transcript_26662/m.87416 type:complete len:258 (+) Transcript_26662:290-1063(+)
MPEQLKGNKIKMVHNGILKRGWRERRWGQGRRRERRGRERIERARGKRCRRRRGQNKRRHPFLRHLCRLHHRSSVASAPDPSAPSAPAASTPVRSALDRRLRRERARERSAAPEEAPREPPRPTHVRSPRSSRAGAAPERTQVREARNVGRPRRSPRARVVKGVRSRQRTHGALEILLFVVVHERPLAQLPQHSRVHRSSILDRSSVATNQPALDSTIQSKEPPPFQAERRRDGEGFVNAFPPASDGSVHAPLLRAH